ncbi:hypothetical protein BFW38_02355 [Terasakiispira papahanaumokuakeensis]|uniref:Uncharacterized protein n=1 Tax=Terasakiispira papahanaumokuakeensis TaxID=197479 RepID=A0A1E2V6B6_9GAMM|nr:hypothetical protein BFW38_02355 [Terasakiispira papahanaumokuakeensis]
MQFLGMIFALLCPPFMRRFMPTVALLSVSFCLQLSRFFDTWFDHAGWYSSAQSCAFLMSF